MDDIRTITNLFDGLKDALFFTDRLQLKNRIVGFVTPKIAGWDSQSPEMQALITDIADYIADQNKENTVIYNFLRYQDRPSLQRSETYRKLSHVFSEQKIHMQAYAEGFLSGFDMELSLWGKFVLERMRHQRENRRYQSPDHNDDGNIVSFFPK